MTHQRDAAEAVARKMLADEWRKEGRDDLAKGIEKGNDSEWSKSAPAVRAIVAALASLPDAAKQENRAPGPSAALLDAFATLEDACKLIAELVEALEPFAGVADEYDDSENDDFEVWQDAGPVRSIRAMFYLRNFRKARTLITRARKTGES